MGSQYVRIVKGDRSFRLRGHFAAGGTGALYEIRRRHNKRTSHGKFRTGSRDISNEEKLGPQHVFQMNDGLKHSTKAGTT